MKYFKNKRLLVSIFCMLLTAASSLNVAAQFTAGNNGVKFENVNDDRDIVVPAENVKMTSQHSLWLPSTQAAPQAVDPAAVYSNVTTFTGNAFANNSGTANTGLTITRLIADDTTLTGTAPFIQGAFVFCVANLNTVAVSARPRVRFYLDTAGNPNTYVAGFSFNAINFPVGVTCYTATNAPVNQASFSQAAIWMGMTFDNVGGTATSLQLDNLGMGIYNPVDVGTSTDNIWRTNLTGSFVSVAPTPGALLNFGGMPPANLGWEFRRAATVGSIARAESNPRFEGGTASWTLTLSASSITGVTASNFALVTTGTIAGASITSVTANNVSPQSTIYTITASLGTGTGTVGLNLVNITGWNTGQTNALPFAGEVYDVAPPLAALVNVGGRITTADGRGIGSVSVSLTGQNGVILTARTNAFGYYNFEDLEVGETYILNVASKRYTFSNPSRIITPQENVGDADFTAEP